MTDRPFEPIAWKGDIVGILLLVALVLAWPTYGLSIAAWLILMLVKAQGTKGQPSERIIDQAIQHLGQQGSSIGTAYREISYADVKRYIDANGCRVTTPISNPHNGWMEFERMLSGQRYQVTLSRTHDGAGSVLTSKKL